ncbi:MAG: MFS transporter [Clostridia bacterium]|nr:MFS transporter [Clostridia bacterium]
MSNSPAKKTEKDTQNLIIALCWCVYSAAYFGRYSFSSSVNSLIDSCGVTNAETGLIATFFFVAYGVGQVANGFLCKRYNARLVFPLSLGGSAVINVLVFFLLKTGFITSHFYIFKYIWLLNGAVQSFIWTSIVFVMGKNLDKSNLAKAGVVIGTTVPAGTFIAYSTGSLMEHLGLYEWSFVLAAIIMSCVGAAWFVFFKPHKRSDIAEAPESAPEKHGKISSATLIIVAGLAIFAISNNLIKDGLQQWIPKILKDTYDFSNTKALILATAIYLCGISGSFIAKKINQKFSDHIICSTIFFAVAATLIISIRLLLNVSAIPVAIMMIPTMICGYAVNNIVTSVAPLSLRDEINPGVAAGVLDGFCYIGSAIGTYALGYIADISSWNTALVLLFAVSVFSAVAALALRLLKRNKA